MPSRVRRAALSSCVGLWSYLPAGRLPTRVCSYCNVLTDTSCACTSQYAVKVRQHGASIAVGLTKMQRAASQAAYTGNQGSCGNLLTLLSRTPLAPARIGYGCWSLPYVCSCAALPPIMHLVPAAALGSSLDADP